MSKATLPSDNHIGRYCGGSHVDEDSDVDGTAFRLRAGEEYLSVNWLEYLAKENEEQIEALRAVYRSKFNKVGKTARIAKLNVGEMIEHVRSESPDSVQLEVIHEPINTPPVDPSHSGIHNIPEDDDLVADLIAEAVLDTYRAS